jgi:hypothetical protein
MSEKITIERAKLGQALHALEESQTYNDTMEFHDRKNKAILALRDALAEQPTQQEPVAWSDAKQSEIHDWFWSLPKWRQAVLLEDKWMLAGAAFLAGKTTPPAQPAPVQEPVAWMSREDYDDYLEESKVTSATVYNYQLDIPLYTTPPAAPVQEPMHPEIKKMYENYFDKWFRESSAAVPENFMDALMFDTAVRDVDAMIALARADERESCAKVCDRMAARCNDIRAAALESAAENIRARGQLTDAQRLAKLSEQHNEKINLYRRDRTGNT